MKLTPKKRQVRPIELGGVPSERKCNQCKEVKPITNFPRNRTKKWGYNTECKVCTKQRLSKRHFEPDASLTEKRCKGCNNVKPISDFNVNRSVIGGYHRLCKECSKTVVLNQGRMALRNTQLKKYYKMTIEQMKQMFVAQGGVCAICKSSFKNRTDMCVDHNHTTGQVRQLLCNACNGGLGRFKEDVARLQGAIEYIKKWNTPTTILN